MVFVDTPAPQHCVRISQFEKHCALCATLLCGIQRQSGSRAGRRELLERENRHRQTLTEFLSAAGQDVGVKDGIL